MRKVLIALGIIIVLIVVGAVIFVATFNVNRYHDQIQSQLQQKLNRNVTLGDMRLGLFPPSFRVQNLAIADDPAFHDPKPFVQAQELAVSVKLLPLLSKSVEINSLTLQRPSVELIKNAQGTWNFASLGKETQGNEAQKAPAQPANQPPSGNQPAQPSKPAEQQFSLSKLNIQDGQLALTDQQKPSPRAVYDHIDATLKDFAPDKPFSIDVAAHLPGPGTQEVRLDGQGGPIAQSQPAMTPFHGTLSLKQVAIGGLAKFLDTPALANTDGVLSGDTKISSDSGKMAAKGQMNVQNAKLHGQDLGYPITADYDVSDDLNADLLTVNNTTVKLGSTPLLINGTMNSKSNPAQLDMRLKASNVSIAEAAKLASAMGVAFAPGTTVSGTVNADVQARGAMDKPALNGTVAGRNIQASGKDIAQPVQIPAINLALTPAEIRSDNFNITSAGTSLATQFSLKQYLSKTPLVDATVKAPNAQLPALLAIGKAYGVTALDKITGAGTLNMDMRASGPVSSIASNEIRRALNGTLKLNFNNVKYMGADITHELSSIGGLVKGGNQGNGQGYTNISKLTGDILVKSGIAQTDNLQALLDVGNLGVKGTANLVNETLNLRATAVLTKDFSQKAGGTSVAGYMQTALANNNGELVIPALITGTFQNPHFAPDVQQMAQMKLKGLVPNFNNPGGAVSGVLGGLLGGKSGANAAQPGQPGQANQAQPQNPVGDIIGLFGKKKKQQPPK
jgi:AsmA protein